MKRKKRITLKAKTDWSKLQKTHYRNFNIKDINDNKIFWKVVKPFLFEKSDYKWNIRVVDNGEIISCNTDIAEKVITFFCNVVKVLKNKVKENLICDV